jgi:hypothetical protein
MTKARTLADMISDGVIGTTELADDVITPVKLDETGNYQMAQLGIGSAASKKLTVQTTGTYDGILLSNGHAQSAARLQLNNDDSKSIQIDVGGSTQSTYGPYIANTAAIVANSAPLNIGTDSANHVAFYTALNERMRLDASGNVGIGDGTLSHTSMLHIYKSGATADLALQSAGASGRKHILQSKTDGSLAFYDNNASSERMRITSAGNVGIGITSSTARLKAFKNNQVVAEIASATNGHLFVSQSDDGTDGFEIYQQHGSNTTRNSFIVNDNRTGSKSAAFLVGGNGKVGISTESPTHALTIGMPDLGDADLSFRSATYSSLGTIKVSHDSGTAEASMRFHTRTGGNEPERMRITSAGLIGVNTISPTQEVSVAGNIDLQSTSGSNATMRRLAWRNTNSSGFEVSNIQGYTGANIYEGQIGFQTKDSGGSMNERMRIDSAGRVTMPYQPLCAFKSSISTTSDQRYGVTNTILNQGGHLDTGSNSGRFTCPVAGNYKCTFIGYTNYTGGYGYIHLRKNGVTQGHATHWNHSGTVVHTTVGNSFIVNCAAGNYLEFWLLNASSRVQDVNITFELIG